MIQDFFTGLAILFAFIMGGEEQQPEVNLRGFSDPFLSLQVGTSPTSGDCLQTDGTNSTWDPCPAGSGGSFPFSATTNFGQVVYSTTTPTLWFRSGLFASSTSEFVNINSRTGNIALGGTVGNNTLTIRPTTTPSTSESVGGVVNINTGTTPGQALVIYNNAASGGQRALSVVCDDATFDTQCGHFRGDGTETILNILGGPTGKGIVKIGSNGVGDADASGLSIDTSLAGNVGQLFFGKGNSSGKLLNIRDYADSEVATLLASGRLGISNTSPTAAFQVGSALMTATTTASTTIMGNFTFGGVTGNTWDDFCTTITGGAGLCDGSDATGGGGGADDPFTHVSFGGLTTSATTSLIHLTNTTLGLAATSTFANFATTSQFTLGAYGSNVGIYFTEDGDGALRIQGIGNANSEAWTANFDDTADVLSWSSDTGGTAWDFSQVRLRSDGIVIDGDGTFPASSDGSLLIGDGSDTGTFEMEDGPACIGDGGCTPDAADGSLTLANNLFLPSGGVINWNAGNTLLTQSTGKLALTGAILGVGTSTPRWNIQSASSTGPQLALSDGSATSAHWTMRNAGGNLYFATSSPTTFATSTASALTILSASNNVGVSTTSPMDALSVVGTSTFVGNTAHFGKAFCGTGGLYQYGLQGLEVCGDDNTTGGGVQIIVDNNNAGANAWGGLTVNNNLADNTLTHFFGMFYNSSAYTDTSFGTFIGQKNLGLIQNTDGLLALISSTSSEALNPAGISFVTGGTASANERARIVPGGFIGLGTTTPKFATVNIASSTAPQLLLSPGGGVLSWTQRSIGGMLYFSTTTTAGTATSSGPAAITIDGNSGSQGLYVATGTQSTASGSIFETNGFVFMHGLTQATGGTNNDLCISGTPNQLIEETTGVCVVSMRDSKHDILDLPTGLDTLLKLRPVSYSPNQDEESDYNDTLYGFVAEELADADPHLARYGIDGKPRTIDDWGILSLVVKSVQELLAKVTGLEERMDAQDARIKELEARLTTAGI